MYIGELLLLQRPQFGLALIFVLCTIRRQFMFQQYIFRQSLFGVGGLGGPPHQVSWIVMCTVGEYNPKSLSAFSPGGRVG